MLVERETWHRFWLYFRLVYDKYLPIFVSIFKNRICFVLYNENLPGFTIIFWSDGWVRRRIILWHVGVALKSNNLSTESYIYRILFGNGDIELSLRELFNLILSVISWRPWEPDTHIDVSYHQRARGVNC